MRGGGRIASARTGSLVTALAAVALLLAGCTLGGTTAAEEIIEAVLDGRVPTPEPTLKPTAEPAPAPDAPDGGPTEIPGLGVEVLPFEAVDDGFTIDVPVGWEIEEHVEGTRLVAVDPAPDPEWRAVLAVAQWDIPPGGSFFLEEWVRDAPTIIEEEFPGAVVISQTFEEIDGHTAARTKFHYEDPVRIRAVDNILIVGNRVYRITFMAPSDHFTANIPLTEHLVRSFRAMTDVEMRDRLAEEDAA